MSLRPPGYELRSVLSGVSAPFIPIRYLFRPIQLHCFHPLLSSLQPVWVMVWVGAKSKDKQKGQKPAAYKSN